MRIGFVGKPSAGKSTFFKAATLADVAIASYPFTTIKPNTGTGFIKIDCVDMEFEKQCNPREGYCINGKRFVPVELIDVAGLVPGAHEGKGMGNQFLDDLRQADALVHVVDCSGGTNERGENVPLGSHDPAKDITFLEYELDAWYASILKKGWERFARQIQQEKTAVARALGKQLSGLGVTEQHVDDLMKKLQLDPEKPTSWTEEHLFQLARELRIKTKPILIACNKIDVPTSQQNYLRLKEQFPHLLLVPSSGDAEIALREAARKELISYVPGESSFMFVNENQLNPQQKKALLFIKEKILDVFGSTGVQQVLNKAVLELLKYIAVFPGGVSSLTDKHGNVLPDCFLLPYGSTPLDFAFKIHTDIGNSFVKAINVKTKLPCGKETLLQHKDVIEIKCSK